jgi:DNA polymerase III alpha subunit
MYSHYLEELTVPLTELKAAHDGKQVTVGGVVVDMREILTKKGDKMAFVKIEDKFGDIEVILFPSVYQQTLGIWERDHVILMRGKVNARGRDGMLTDELKIMVDDAREITFEQAQAYKVRGRKLKVPKIVKGAKLAAIKGPGAAVASAVRSSNTDFNDSVPSPGETMMSVPERVYIRIISANDNAMLMALKQAIDEYQGSTEVVLVLGADNQKQIVKLPGGMTKAQPALERLQLLVGRDNVKIH